MNAPPRTSFFLLALASLYKSSHSSSSRILGATTKQDGLFGEFIAERGWHRNRRTAKTRVLEYGKRSGRGHPFEQYSVENLAATSVEKKLKERRQQKSFDFPAAYDEINFRTRASFYMNYSKSTTESKSPAVEADYSSYEPLRIYVDSRRLDLLVESNPDYYADVVDYIVSKALPDAIEFWSVHLSTVPVEGSILVYPEECSQPFRNDDSTYHEFNDTDLVLYLILDEGPCLGNDPPIAFSNDCIMDQFDRPVAVRSTFNVLR